MTAREKLILKTLDELRKVTRAQGRQIDTLQKDLRELHYYLANQGVMSLKGAAYYKREAKDLVNDRKKGEDS